MTVIRRLERTDDAQATTLWAEAFGDWEQSDRTNPLDRPGRNFWCAEDGGEIVATVGDREFTSWLGGSQINTSGIAAVAVRAEARGRGLLTPLFDRVLDSAHERGALVSALFPTAPGIYRRFGFAEVASLDDVRVPTAALAVRGDTLTTRRAGPEDIDAIRGVYTRWASRHNGPLTRLGASFPDADVLSGLSGVTVVEATAGQVSGYVSWKRGKGYGDDACIRVADLVADDPVSLASLMRVLASFDSVASSTIIRTSGIDEWQRLVRTARAQVVNREPYMFAVLDVAVLERVTYPEGLELSLPFTWNGHGHVLTVQSQRGHLERAEVGAARSLDRQGLALTITGAERSAGLRRLGHLTGDDSADIYWDALFGIRQPHVRNYF